MSITVRYWSWFKELAGTDHEEHVLPEGSKLADLLSAVRGRHGRFRDVARSTLVAVGLDYQTPDHVLREGDEVSLFPPVQGG